MHGGRREPRLDEVGYSPCSGNVPACTKPLAMVRGMTAARKAGWLARLGLGDQHARAVGGVVDHRLARRALLDEFRRGRLRQDQVCDAHPELLRAARNVGEPAAELCPVCLKPDLMLVAYAFGPRMPSHGRCIATTAEWDELVRTARRTPGAFSAYVVEACPSCSWHHLVRTLPVARREAEATRSSKSG